MLLALLAGACTLPEEDEPLTRITYAFWGSPSEERATRALIQAFEEDHPGIRVETRHFEYGRYLPQLQTFAAAGMLPDVMMLDAPFFDEFASRGVLKDLTGEFERLTDESVLSPMAKSAVFRAGRAYGLPLRAGGWGTLVNVDALREAGVVLPENGALTWDFLLEVGSALAERDRSPVGYVFTWPPLLTFFHQHGASLFDDPHNPARVTIRSPEAEEAIHFLRRASATGWVHPGVRLGERENLELFKRGITVLTFCRFPAMENLRGRVSFEWTVLPFPAGPLSSTAPMHAVSVGVSTRSKHPEAARSLARFLASPEAVRLASAETQTWPAYPSMVDDNFFPEDWPEPMARLFLESMGSEAGQPAWWGAGTAEIERLVNQRLSNALSRPELPADTVLAELENDLRRWLERNRLRQ